MRSGNPGRLEREVPVDAGDRLRHLDEEVAEVVVNDADDRTTVVVPYVHGRHGHDGIVRDDALRVAVVRTEKQPATRGAQARVRAVVADDRGLAESIRWPDSDGVVELHAHAFD